MLASIEAKLAGFGILVLLILGIALWSHHQGAEAQKAHDQSVINEKNVALQYASTALSNAAHVFDQLNADAKAQMDAARASAQRSHDILAQEHQSEADQAKLAAAWRQKFLAASASPKCASTLEQTICPEVFEPLSSPSH